MIQTGFLYKKRFLRIPSHNSTTKDLIGPESGTRTYQAEYLWHPTVSLRPVRHC
jgi:hypothetical protein